MTWLVTFWACCFSTRITPYKALRYVLYEDIVVFLLILIVDVGLYGIQTSFKNINNFQQYKLYLFFAKRLIHVPICIVFLIFFDCWFKNGSIISRFNCWHSWRIFGFFLLLFTTIVAKIIQFTAWISSESKNFEKTTGMTSKWFIIESCWGIVRTGLEIYLCFSFKSVKKYLKALNRSDDFDGEHFDNVSQSKSEKARVEKHKKELEEKQEKKEKQEAENINDLIESRLQKFKDFSTLKKPEIQKEILKSQNDISAISNWYI